MEPYLGRQYQAPRRECACDILSSCPQPESAELSQLCPSPAPAARPPVSGVSVSTTGAGERGAMLSTVSDHGSVSFRSQRNFPFRISQDPSSSAGRGAEQGQSPQWQRCPRSHQLKLGSGGTCQVSCLPVPCSFPL